MVGVLNRRRRAGWNKCVVTLLCSCRIYDICRCQCRVPAVVYRSTNEQQNLQKNRERDEIFLPTLEFSICPALFSVSADPSATLVDITLVWVCGDDVRLVSASPQGCTVYCHWDS